MSGNTKVFQPTSELTDLLVRSGSLKKEEALAANAEFAKALELPLRQGILNGDILDGIFEPIQLAQSATPEFPLDFLAPGTERNFVAYTIPNHGYIPERHEHTLRDSRSKNQCHRLVPVLKRKQPN